MKKKLTQLAQALAVKYPPLRVLLRGTDYLLRRTRYLLRGIAVKKEPKTIFFASFEGQSYTDSPRAIYEYCLQSPDFQDYQFIWRLLDENNAGTLAQNPRTRVVSTERDYLRALHCAGYWVLNYREDVGAVPRKNQVFMQCWHGTPLKRLGCDLQEISTAMNTHAEQRVKYRREARKLRYFLSPSPFASDCFCSAFDMKALGKAHTLVETGYPRNDYLTRHTPQEVQAVKAALGIEHETRKIILYAPTWRDDQFRAGIGYTYDLGLDFDLLREQLGREYLILFRAHYLVRSAFDFARYADFVRDVSDYSDIGRLYPLADLLITDYSSVFFDYAILRRPMLFYMYDLANYRDALRGFYLDLAELPGPVLANQTALADAIQGLCAADWQGEKYQDFYARFNPFDDGNASQRAAKILLGDEKE